MVRAVLTLWYTITALTGPALCCCTVRTFTPSPIVTRDVEAPSPKRSCCGSDPVEGCQKADEPAKDRTPADCPCKQRKVDQLPPHLGSAGGSELASPFRDLDPSLVGLPLIVASDWPPVRAADAQSHRPLSGSKLSGRDLLTACQLLRC